MTRKPAASYVEVPDGDEQLEAAKIPLKNKGLDIASQMQSVKQGEPDLASVVDNYSASVEQTLSVIEAMEHTLQHKRKQIDEIQTRHEALAREYRRLNGSLASVNKDLAQQFSGIISDLETDIPIEASDLGLETSDLPPLPKFLGDHQES